MSDELKEPYECLLYIHEFKHKAEEDEEAYHGHPHPGRVYVSEYNPLLGGYRLYIGRENNDRDMDGIFLDGLSGDNGYWSWKVMEMEPDQATDYKLSQEDIELVANWVKNDGKSEFFEGKMRPVSARTGEPIVDLAQIFSSLMEAEQRKESDKHVDIEGQEEIVLNFLNTTLEKDEEFHNSSIDLMAYLLSTFSDKYQQAALDTRSLLYDETYGKGFNVGNAYKYIARYMTEGFEKSNNTKDLMKAIHYLLFELTRRRIHG